jgi:putrescine transport system substrate-binding protein
MDTRQDGTMSARAAWAGHCLSLLLLAGCADDRGTGNQPEADTDEKILNVYNWADYIGPTTLADFERETGIKVNYDTYDSNEILETKLLTGRTGYDVVVPSLTNFERLAKAGAFQKLDKSRLPNLANMDPWVQRNMAVNDPGNEYAINYMWGTVGIGYVPKQVEKALGTRTIDSWSAVFDPAVAAKLATCGIALLDAPEDVFDSALIYLGRDPNSEAAEDLTAVEALLQGVRPYLRYIDAYRHVDDLASGEICVALSWNGQVIQARERGATAVVPVEVAYANPKEGSTLWFDAIGIPADAPHPGNAHKFLNFLMDPEVIAAISRQIRYANGNAMALSFMDEDLKDDPSVYPPPETVRSLHPVKATTQAYSRELNRAWTRIKTGQ